MPKRREDLQVRGEDVRRWIRQGHLSAFPTGTNRVLRVHRAFRVTFPLVKIWDRAERNRRMTISAGSFLNSRWIRINKTWDVWPDTQSARTSEKIAELRSRSIIQVLGRWYLQIYEVVSGTNKLRRQRVKIRAGYSNERNWRTTVMASIESDIAKEAVGAIDMTEAELRNLRFLNRRIGQRIQDMDRIGSRLSSREVFAYAEGLGELEFLRRSRKSLEVVLDQTSVQTFKPNFDAFLRKQANDLNIIVDLDVRHCRFWAQWHIRRAAEVLEIGPQTKCFYYLGRATEYLDRAIETLQGWADSLSEEETRHVIPA
jgi:hypothetical protein